MPYNNRDDRRSNDPYRIPARERLSKPDPKYSSFRSLCIKGGWPRHARDPEIIEEVDKAFRKFREYNVKAAMVAGEKIAYINFPGEPEAKAALEKMSKVHVFDRTLEVEPVIKGVLPIDPRDRDRRRSRSPAPAPAASKRSPPPRSPPRHGPPRSVVTKEESRGERPSRSDREEYPRSRGNEREREREREREVFFDHRGPSNYAEREEKHISRILHVSELEKSLVEKDLYDKFQQYANVMSIDMKYPNNAPYAYANVAFLNPDDAERARKGMQNKLIGRSGVKISYGKSPSSDCIWVGNLNRKATVGLLEQEFDRYGEIKKIDYTKGDSFAYIVFENPDSAKQAIKHLDGKYICGGDEKTRFDFVNYDEVTLMTYHQRLATQKGAAPYSPEVSPPSGGRKVYSSNNHDGDMGRSKDNRRENRGKYEQDMGERRSDRDRQRGASPGQFKYNERDNRERRASPGRHGDQYRGRDDRREGGGRHASPNNGANDYRPRGGRRSPSPQGGGGGGGGHKGRWVEVSPGNNDRRPRGDFKRGRISPEPKRNRNESFDEPRQKRRRSPSPRMRPEDATDIPNLVKCLDSCWKGYLILKNSAFNSHLLLLNGSRDVCRKLLVEASNNETATALKITQRLRCETTKLQEVRRRMESATEDGYCILLASQNTDATNSFELPEGTSTRQFKNLVSYLKSKNSAGVIGLPVGASENQGVLQAFPPCKFFAEDLAKVAPKVSESENLDDHLIIVMFSGSN